MNAICAAGAEQSTGIGQVGRTIAQTERATQQNAALVEEIVAATELLAAETARLATLVDGFSGPEATSTARDARTRTGARKLIARHGGGAAS